MSPIRFRCANLFFSVVCGVLVFGHILLYICSRILKDVDACINYWFFRRKLFWWIAVRYTLYICRSSLYCLFSKLYYEYPTDKIEEYPCRKKTIPPPTRINSQNKQCQSNHSFKRISILPLKKWRFSKP